MHVYLPYLTYLCTYASLSLSKPNASQRKARQNQLQTKKKATEFSQVIFAKIIYRGKGDIYLSLSLSLVLSLSLSLCHSLLFSLSLILSLLYTFLVYKAINSII